MEMSALEIWMLSATNGLLGALVGAAVTIWVVRYRARFESDEARKRLLRYMRGELRRAREALVRWEESIAGQPSWHHADPRAWDLRSLHDHTVELADLPDQVVDLAEDVNRRMNLLREAWSAGERIYRRESRPGEAITVAADRALRDVRSLADQVGGACRQLEGEITRVLGEHVETLPAPVRDRQRVQ